MDNRRFERSADFLKTAKLQKKRKEKIASRNKGKKKTTNTVKHKPIKESKNRMSNYKYSSRNVRTSCRNCGKKLMGKPLENHEAICTAKRYSHGYRGQGYSGNSGQGRLFHD
jgi:hypothetical protein